MFEYTIHIHIHVHIYIHIHIHVHIYIHIYIYICIYIYRNIYTCKKSFANPGNIMLCVPMYEDKRRSRDFAVGVSLRGNIKFTNLDVLVRQKVLTECAARLRQVGLGLAPTYKITQIGNGIAGSFVKGQNLDPKVCERRGYKSPQPPNMAQQAITLLGVAVNLLSPHSKPKALLQDGRARLRPPSERQVGS